MRIIFEVKSFGPVEITEVPRRIPYPNLLNKKGTGMKIELPEIPGHEWRDTDYKDWCATPPDRGARIPGRFLVATPIKKVYDWNKTGNQTLVESQAGGLDEYGAMPRAELHAIHQGWQVHLGGVCPVDPEASIVEVILRDGRKVKDLASDLNWDHNKPGEFRDLDIIAYHFVKLADGYDWS